MRISLKLTAAFLVIASLVGATGYLAQRTTGEVRTQIQRLKESAFPRIVGACQTTAGLYAMQLTVRESGSAESRAGMSSSALQSLDARRTVVEQGMERLRLAAQSRARWDAAGRASEIQNGPSLPQESALALLQDRWLAHQRLMEDLRRAMDEDRQGGESFVHQRLEPHFENELLPLLAAQREQSEQEVTQAINSVERSLAVADTQRGMLTFVAAASAIVIGLIMSRSIGKPLAMLRRAAEELGRGRLDTRVSAGWRDEIGVLAHALNQMAADLQDKTVSKQYLENILQSMREMLIVADCEGRICRLNPAACSELVCSPEELVGRPLRELFASEALPAGGDFLRSLADGAESVLRGPSSGRIPVLCSVAEMRGETGEVEGFVCAAWNISRQKDAEHRLRASLREKELLLKEVHHRVKNNLQVISSLLNLQAQELRDPHMVRLFRESQGRVRSLALIHEQLYRSDDLSRIDVAAYVQELVERLAPAGGDPAARVRFCFDLQPCQLPIDLAIPCGMIVNELVSNSLQHAYPDRRPGIIRIAFALDGDGYVLTVADDGVGVSQRLLEGKAETLGLKVVQALTRQIGGRLALQSEQGSTFVIHFAAPRAADPPLPAD